MSTKTVSEFFQAIEAPSKPGPDAYFAVVLSVEKESGFEQALVFVVANSWKQACLKARGAKERIPQSLFWQAEDEDAIFEESTIKPQAAGWLSGRSAFFIV